MFFLKERKIKKQAKADEAKTPTIKMSQERILQQRLNPESFLPTIFNSQPKQGLRFLSIHKPDSAAQILEGQHIFKIRTAATLDRAHAASVLIQNMYAWRGYDTTQAAAVGIKASGEEWRRKKNEVTLIAAEGDKTFATLTVRYDSPEGLACDELYRDELNQFRAQGSKFCEFTRLAMDRAPDSKEVFASLMHIGYIYAYDLNKCTDVVIEVNPRHVSFYKKMLGMTQLGSEKICPRVNAPAVLLHVPFSFVQHQIAQFGGLREKAKQEKSFYPYFFNEWDEADVVARLLKATTV